MAKQARPVTPDPRAVLIGITMLGNTTNAVMHLLPQLQQAGYQGVIFHANGVGGGAIEELIARGMFAAVIDYTLSELAGEVAGGFHAPSRPRVMAAARTGHIEGRSWPRRPISRHMGRGIWSPRPCEAAHPTTTIRKLRSYESTAMR